MPIFDNIFKHIAGEFSKDIFVTPTELFQEPLFEAIMQKSPFYDYVIKQGIEQGIEQGERNNTVESILELLSIRFEIATTDSIESDLESIDTLQRLKQLRLAAAKAENLADFMRLLQNGATPV